MKRYFVKVEGGDLYPTEKIQRIRRLAGTQGICKVQINGKEYVCADEEGIASSFERAIVEFDLKHICQMQKTVRLLKDYEKEVKQHE